MEISTYVSEVSAPNEGALRGRIFTDLLSSVVPRGRTLLDLGCGAMLFSQRAAEHGYTVTGVDARSERVPGRLGDRIAFVRGDVRRFDVAGWDVVAILGLLYHLSLDDQLELLSRCSQNRSVIVDTQVHDPDGYTPEAGPWAHDPIVERGHEGVLFPEGDNPMAAVGNETSFWHTDGSMRRLFERSGFTSLTVVEPAYRSKYGSRRFYVASGQPPSEPSRRDAPLALSASSYRGICAVCGTDGTFRYEGGPPRESFKCHGCHGTLRYRHQAEVLLSVCGQASQSIAALVRDPEFEHRSIYEAAIGGSFRRCFAELPNYVNSYYWSDVAPGEVKQGVRCEDLERLTFGDRSFDLVLTSDVFEHVRHPWLAFAEVSRVLKPGGWHVFTVPFYPMHPTRPRFDPGADDLPLMPRRFHGSPIDPGGSLVVTDFGHDLAERLRPLGFDVEVHGTVGRMFTVAAQRRTQ